MKKKLLSILLTTCMVLALLPSFTQPAMAAYSPTIKMTLDGLPMSPTAIVNIDTTLFASTDSKPYVYEFTEYPTGTFNVSNIPDGTYPLVIGDANGDCPLNYRLRDFHLLVDQSSFTISNATTYPLTLAFYSVSYKPGSYANETTTNWMHIAAKDRGQYTRSNYLYTRAGYKQIGWSTDANGTSKTYNLNEAIYPTSAMVLYPAWGKLRPVSITDGDGVSSTKTSATGSITGSITSGTSAVEGETVTITPGTPATGYILSAVKYNDGTDHVLTKSDGKYSFTMPAAAVTISAEYKLNTFAVTYNPGANGIGSQQTDTKTGGTALTLKSTIFTREGYDQTGWAITDGGTKAYELGGSYTTDAAKNFYPVWTAKAYGISYALNGGSVASANPANYTIESNDITLSNPTCSGYSFVGWTGSNGETAQTNVSILKGSTGNKTYTANWKADKPSSAPAASIVTAKTDESLTITTQDGYEYSVNGIDWYSGAGSYTFTDLNSGAPYNLVYRKAAVTTGNTSAASDASDALSVSTKTAPTTLSDSGVTYSVKDGTITGLESTYEYSLDNGTTWKTTPVTGVTFTAGNVIQVRTRETDDAMPSKPQTLGTIGTLAEAPTYAIDIINEKTTVSVPATVEYNTTSSDAATWTAGQGTNLTLTPDTTYYFRIAATETTLAGKVQTLVIPARPTVPDVSVVTIAAGNDSSHTAITLAGAYEYILANALPDISASGTVGTGSASETTATGGQHVYIRVKAANTSFASDWTDCGTVSLGVDSITLTNVGYDVAAETLTGTTTNMQYSLDSGNTWQDCAAGNTTGLTFITGTVKVRQKDKPTNEHTVGTIAAPAEAPIYAIDFINEKTTVSFPATVEYNMTSATATTWTAGQGTTLTLTPGNTYYLRVAATDTTLAGNVQTLSVPARPAVPDVSVVTIAAGNDSSHTTITLAGTYEYILADALPDISASGTVGTGSASEITATGGQHVYIRVKAAANTSFASAWTDCGEVQLGVNSINLASVGYDVAAGTLTGTTTNMQYSLDGAAWQDCTTDNTTGLTFVAGTVKVRQKDKVTNEATVTTLAAPAVSDLPTLGSKTYNSVTLTTMAGYEYSKDDGKTWQDSNVFSGLSGSTEYSFVGRIKATATTLPGTVSAALAVKTDSAPSGGLGNSSASTGVPVIVDGKTENIGTENKTGDATTVTVDQSKLGENINGATTGSSVLVPVSENSAATASLVVKNIEDMAQKGMTLTVQTGSVAYNLNTSAIDTAALTAAFPGADMSKVPFDVTIQNSSVNVEGETLVLSPVAFSVTATYNGKTVSVDTFSAYIDRVIEVTPKQAAKITTAVVVNADGSTRHVPTNVVEKDGKYYAIINSRTNSTYALIQNEVTFADAKGKWYEGMVNEMGSRKIIAGLSASVFGGGASITRAEFAAILVRALGLPTDGTSSFSDVPTTAWYTGAVATAVQYGLAGGTGKNCFSPNAAITRQEAMLMLQRAAALTEFSGTSGTLDGFTDADAVNSWAKDAAKWNVGSGLIKGSDGKLNPTAKISRAESATIILRLLQKAGLVDVRS